MRKKAKADGDKAKDLFSKLLMNSLYGKFASNPLDYKDYFITDDIDIRDATIILQDIEQNYAGDLGKWFVIESPIDESQMKFYNIATAASITGYVRAFLWRSICAVGVENVLYCDTDSLATKSIENLSIGGELGQWKNEGEFIYAAIAGRKLYAFKDKNGEYKIASKGARLTAEEITEIAAGGSAYYRFDAPTFSYNKEPVFIERNILST
jgi:DNA polymerase elongation subunit (family B)